MNRTGSALLALALAATAGAAGAQSTTPIDPAAAKKAVELCSTCHGPYGISTSPDFPILAAQREGYLEAQIEAFRSHARAEKDAHDIMWGIAGNLDPSIIKGIGHTALVHVRRKRETPIWARGICDDDAVMDRGVIAPAGTREPR